MDFGDWIGAVLLLGGVIFSAFSEKKKAEEKKNTPRKKSPIGHYQEDEKQEVSTPNYFANALGQFFVVDDCDEEAKEAEDSHDVIPTATTRPTPPPVMPLIEEWQRTTAQSAPKPSVSEQPKEKPFDLHDKNTLRRAIILADILPPKF